MVWLNLWTQKLVLQLHIHFTCPLSLCIANLQHCDGDLSKPATKHKLKSSWNWVWSLNRQFQCKSMKNYWAQTPENLVLTKILQKFRKMRPPRRCHGVSLTMPRPPENVVDGVKSIISRLYIHDHFQPFSYSIKQLYFLLLRLSSFFKVTFAIKRLCFFYQNLRHVLIPGLSNPLKYLCYHSCPNGPELLAVCLSDTDYLLIAALLKKCQIELKIECSNSWL